MPFHAKSNVVLRFHCVLLRNYCWSW